MRASLRVRILLGSLLGGSAVALAGVGPAAAETYQAPLTASITIKVVRTSPLNTCVKAEVIVRSDAGTPTGSVDLSVDGTVYARKVLPKNGSTVIPIGCGGGNRRVAFRETAVAPRAVAAAYVLLAQPAVATASMSEPVLGVGDHVLEARYVPTGNWQGASATARITITAPSTIPVPHGFDAGLDSYEVKSAGLSSPLRGLVSGLALAAAAASVAFYRRGARRSSSES